MVNRINQIYDEPVDHIFIPYIIEAENYDYESYTESDCPAYVATPIYEEVQDDYPEGFPVLNAYYTHFDMALKLSIFIRMLHECKYFELTGKKSVKIFIKEYQSFDLITMLIVNYRTKDQQKLNEFPCMRYTYDVYSEFKRVSDNIRPLVSETLDMETSYVVQFLKGDEYKRTRFLTRKVCRKLWIILMNKKIVNLLE